MSSSYRQTVEDMTAQIQQCAASGDYAAAEKLQKQLDNLKATKRCDATSEIQAEHESYQRAIDDAYTEEQKQFNAQWEQRLDEYNRQATLKMDGLKKELAEKLDQLDKKFVSKPVRFSG